MIDATLLWEKETDLFIAVISTMLSICFPLLLQNIQSIDTKYGSQHLVSMYCDRTSYITYKWGLGFAMTLLLVYLCSPYVFNCDICDTLRCLILSSVIVLLITTIFMFRDVLRFVRTDLLVDMFAKNTKKPKDVVVAAWTDLMVYLIKNEKDKLAMKAYEYISYQIINSRKQQEKNVEYTSEINKSIVKVNDELCKSKDRYFTIFNDIGILTVYAGERDWKQNSTVTTSNIWRCLLAQIKYERDDFIYSHWTRTHQRYVFYGYPQRAEEEYDKQQEHDFLLFYIALGAHLLYSERFRLLGKCLFQSHHVPPQYHLTPNTFDKILKWYAEISKDKFITNFAIESKFHFLDNDDTFGDTVRNSLKDYLCLLLVRLEYLVPTMINEDQWQEYDGYDKTTVGIDQTIKIVEDIKRRLSNKNIKRYRNLLECDRMVVSQPQSISAFDFIEAFEKKLKQELAEAEESKTADKEIIENYKKTIKDIVENKVQKYSYFIESNEEFPTESLNPIIALPKGIHLMNCSFYDIYPIEHFSTDRIYDISGFPETVASIMTSELSRCMTEFIMTKNSVKYDVFMKEAKDALEKFQLTNDSLLLFYNGCEWIFKDELTMDDNGTVEYKGINVIYMSEAYSYNNYIVVIDKRKMPKLQFVEPTEKLKEKHHLEELSAITKTYWGYTELENDKCLREKIAKRKGMSKDVLNKYASLYIHFYAKFYLPKDSIKAIIALNDDFARQTSDLDRIKPILA